MFAGMSAAGGAAVSGSVMQTASMQLTATPLQRVQLLVQVVRGCVTLVDSHSSSSGLCDTAGRPALQGPEQLAVLLLALQVVQLLCCPQSDKAGTQQQQQQQGEECDHDPAESDLAAVLSTASQSDVEQLMSAVVDLIKLAEVHTKALADHQDSPTGHHTDALAAAPAASSLQQQHHSSPWEADAAGAAGVGAVAAASHMISSLLQVPLPDPAGVLYQAALGSCRSAAVEEVMGNWRAALDGYSLAADLLLFLGQQWPELPTPADPGLLPREQAALHRLYCAVNGRLAAVVAEAPPLALACA
jgi:hypothetical protein